MKTSTNPVDAPPSAPALPAPALVTWGRVLLVLGLFLLAFYTFVYSTSLPWPNPGPPPDNTPLLLNRLIGSLGGIVISFTGALCLIAQVLRSPAPKPSARALPPPSAPTDPSQAESQPRSVRGEILQGRRRR